MSTDQESLCSCPDLSKNLHYKTRLCNTYADQGECPYGKKCQFAHGLEEIRKRWNFKTKICDKVREGKLCEYGDSCRYIHDGKDYISDMTPDQFFLATDHDNEISSNTYQSLPSSIINLDMFPEFDSPEGIPEWKYVRKKILRWQKKHYKTRMCENFLDGIECRYESKCLFAHGMHELRNANSFKKAPCEN